MNPLTISRDGSSICCLYLFFVLRYWYSDFWSPVFSSLKLIFTVTTSATAFYGILLMEEVEICTLYCFQRQLWMSRTCFKQSGAPGVALSTHPSISLLKPQGPWWRCWQAGKCSHSISYCR